MYTIFAVVNSMLKQISVFLWGKFLNRTVQERPQCQRQKCVPLTSYTQKKILVRVLFHQRALFFTNTLMKPCQGVQILKQVWKTGAVTSIDVIDVLGNMGIVQTVLVGHWIKHVFVMEHNISRRRQILPDRQSVRRSCFEI